MEMFVLLFAGLVLAIIAGAIAGFVAISRTNELRRDNRLLRDRLESLSRKVESLDSDEATEAPTSQQQRADALAELRESIAARQEESRQPLSARTQALDEDSPEVIVHATPVEPSESQRPLADFFGHIQANWMTWLGGACVSLAGIFLVRYSMDQGWLGPAARILAALMTGGALIATAEVLRRRNATLPPALAAMAGAGCLTLYGALFAALKLYGLVSPAVAFAAMAVVALGTMGLALLYGPVLAAFGILGAYGVPIIVSTGRGDIVLALGYALVISLSALLLLRHVYRLWLWWGFVAGALGWWVLSLAFGDADAVRAVYLAALAYLIAAAPTGDWALVTRMTMDYQGYDSRQFIRALSSPERNILLTYGLMLLAVGIGISVSASDASVWSQGLPLFALTLWMARSRDAVFALPWSVLLVTIGGWLLNYFDTSGGAFSVAAIPMANGTGFLIYLLAFALMAAGAGFALFKAGRRPAVWASLSTLAPMLLLALGYLLNLRPETDVFWALSTATFALCYVVLAGAVLQKQSIESLVVWLFIAGHFGFGLAAAMVFENAGLTLALAAQMISVAWVIRRFDLPELGWLFKLVVAIVIVRLTVNPWLADYSTATHWSLWTFGGATAMAAFAAWWLRGMTPLARWAEGAALHLFVLTIWSELRYQLNNGDVYANTFSFAESTLTLLLAASLGLVYHHRAKVSASLASLYRIYALGLASAAIALYVWSVLRVLVSDGWVASAVGSIPIWNLATLAFGAPVILAALYSKRFIANWRPYANKFVGIGFLVFVSLQVRHLWTGTVNLATPAVSDGELYTYSAVWLALAIGALLIGSVKDRVMLYRAGIVVLAVVIAKLFLIDLSGLEGLLRVASFMGLGLSLLGVAYLHQRLGNRGPTAQS
ncbi:MAG: DUF2339 domain-containing protein [Pseudomonadota bacterium]